MLNSIAILKHDGRELVTGSGKGCRIKKKICFIEESVISVQLDEFLPCGPVLSPLWSEHMCCMT